MKLKYGRREKRIAKREAAEKAGQPLPSPFDSHNPDSRRARQLRKIKRLWEFQRDYPEIAAKMTRKQIIAFEKGEFKPYEAGKEILVSLRETIPTPQLSSLRPVK